MDEDHSQIQSELATTLRIIQQNISSLLRMQLPRKMSVNAMAISISRTLGNRNEGGAKHSNEVKLAGEESKDKLYEPKHRQKVVRVLTVLAYVVSVSLAAIILSLYYTFIWDPKDHALYTFRQTSLNSTSKVECLNLTIPVIAELSTTINGSHIIRVPVMQAITNNSVDPEKHATNVPAQVPSPDFIGDSVTEDMEGTSESSTIESALLIVQPELHLSDEERKETMDERVTQDTDDFDFI